MVFFLLDYLINCFNLALYYLIKFKYFHHEIKTASYSKIFEFHHILNQFTSERHCTQMISNFVFGGFGDSRINPYGLIHEFSVRTDFLYCCQFSIFLYVLLCLISLLILFYFILNQDFYTMSDYLKEKLKSKSDLHEYMRTRCK